MPGLFSLQSFAAAAGISYSYAGKTLNRLADEGKLEREGVDRYRIV